MNFTPDDLKNRWPVKYDNWKFVKNAKGEWIGYGNKVHGLIVTVKDELGQEYPDIELREINVMAPVLGAVPWSIKESVSKSKVLNADISNDLKLIKKPVIMFVATLIFLGLIIFMFG